MLGQVESRFIRLCGRREERDSLTIKVQCMSDPNTYAWWMFALASETHAPPCREVLVNRGDNGQERDLHLAGGGVACCWPSSVRVRFQATSKRRGIVEPRQIPAKAKMLFF